MTLGRPGEDDGRMLRPFFFESIRIEHPHKLPGGANPPSIEAIHARFRDDTSLRLHVRKVQVDLQSVSKNEYERIIDLIKWLTNAQYLSISGRFTVPETSRSDDHRGDDDPSFQYNMLDCIRCIVRHMTRLRVLRCVDSWSHGLGPGCKGNDLIREIDIPTLRKLDLVGLGKSIGPPSLNKQRTASFTSLWLSSFNETPEMRSQYISWPQTLTAFEFHRQYEDRVYIDLPMVQSWLQIHKDTLKCIKIHQLSLEGRGRLFDARIFVNLEHLHLSRWMMSSALDTAQEDAELLLSPKLRKFVWNFDATIDDGFREDWTDFGDKEEDWVRNLTRIAIDRGHPLQEVWIEFAPENMGQEVEGYPWDRMDRLHEEVQPFGLKVRYNEPIWTRNEWTEEVEWQREQRAQSDS